MCAAGLWCGGIAPKPVPGALHVLWGFQSPGGIFVRPWDCCDFGMSFQVSLVGGGKGGSIASHCSGSVSTLVSQVLP